MTLCTLGFFQNINFDQLDKKNRLHYNDGTVANAVYYNGTANRQDLIYYITGNLNFKVAGLYNIPLSFPCSIQYFGMNSSPKDNVVPLIESTLQLCNNAPS